MPTSRAPTDSLSSPSPPQASEHVGVQSAEPQNPPHERNKATRPETVILVHGTFAAPKKDGPPQWYEPGSAFVTTLNGELAKLGSTAKCWAHAPDVKQGSASVFSWTGENHWLDRDEAAIKLAALLDDLRRQGWRCHVVAHSHGGNVTLEALRRMRVSTDPGYADAWDCGSIVTMGTPFLTPPDIANPFFRELNTRAEAKRWPEFRWLGASLLFGSSLVLLMALGLWLAGVDARSLAAIRLSWWAVVATLIVGVSWGVAIFALRAIAAKEIGAATSSTRKRLLALTSDHDEAWQLLHGLFEASSPTAKRGKSSREKPSATPATRLVRLLANTDALAFPSRSYTVDVVGWTLIALLFLAAARNPAAITAKLSLIALGTLGLLAIGLVGIPLRTRAFIAAPYRMVRALRLAGLYGFSALIAAIVRRLTLPIARAKAAGSDYLPTTKPLPSREPGHVDSDFYELRILNDQVMQDTIAKRNVTAGSALGELLAVLGRHGAGSTEFDELLEKIAGDVSLCHAAYYAKTPYIETIAKWLARTEAELTMIDEGGNG